MKDILKMVVYAGIFTVPFVVLIIANSLFFPFITGKNFAFRIIVEIIFAAWILLALYDTQFRPKFSWIAGCFAALIGVMFFANLFGAHPLSSFWSNFERMEGYVTLVHVFAYFLMVGTMITSEKLWNRLFNATLLSAVLLSLYAFAQLSGNIAINQGGWRLDGTLGNSAYMAIYMLFHIFIAALMFVRTSSRNWKIAYGLLGLLFIFLLIQTATRGTILGFAGGSLVAAIYVALFAKGYPQLRKIAAGGLAAIVLLIGAFIAFKDAPFIQNYEQLARVANITLADATTRVTVWTMALEGVKERPLLGWGQSNYNYVFNKYYDPSMYSQEPWFDRVHNIVLDWLIAGGVVGAVLYFSVIATAVYYVAIRPLLRNGDESFGVVERGLILGLLAGYVFHNMFVFDNIVSYIFFATILGFIHSRVAQPIKKVEELKVEKAAIEQIAAPTVAVALVLVFYFVNVPGMQAAGDIINAFRSNDPEVRMQALETALSRNSFGNQEVREQMMQQVASMVRSPQIPDERKQEMLKQAEEELLKQVVEKPNDARIHVFLASFYRMAGKVDESIAQLEIARTLSPRKQQIIFEQGTAYIQKGDMEKALEYFKEAYELAPEYAQARVLYAMSGVYTGKPELVDELINTDQLRLAFAKNDLAVHAVYQSKNYALLKEMLALRIADAPQDVQTRVNLAVTYYESGDVAGAIEVLEKAIEEVPTFKAQGEAFIADLRAGRAPGERAPAATPIEVNAQ